MHFVLLLRLDTADNLGGPLEVKTDNKTKMVRTLYLAVCDVYI